MINQDFTLSYHCPCHQSVCLRPLWWPHHLYERLQFSWLMSRQNSDKHCTLWKILSLAHKGGNTFFKKACHPPTVILPLVLLLSACRRSVRVHSGGKARWEEQCGLHPVEPAQGSQRFVWRADEGGGPGPGQLWGWRRRRSYCHYRQWQSLCWWGKKMFPLLVFPLIMCILSHFSINFSDSQRVPTLKRCRIEPSRSVMVETSWLTGTECPQWRSLWLQPSMDLLYVLI